jgi:hypothetical protein
MQFVTLDDVNDPAASSGSGHCGFKPPARTDLPGYQAAASLSKSGRMLRAAVMLGRASRDTL